MNRRDMQKLVDDLNQTDEVDNARIVEFLGKPHVHVDLADGDIEVITEEGESRVIPIHTSSRRN